MDTRKDCRKILLSSQVVDNESKQKFSNLSETKKLGKNNHEITRRNTKISCFFACFVASVSPDQARIELRSASVVSAVTVEASSFGQFPPRRLLPSDLFLWLRFFDRNFATFGCYGQNERQNYFAVKLDVDLVFACFLDRIAKSDLAAVDLVAFACKARQCPSRSRNQTAFHARRPFARTQARSRPFGLSGLRRLLFQQRLFRARRAPARSASRCLWWQRWPRPWGRR